jgi:hypothetical protein
MARASLNRTHSTDVIVADALVSGLGATVIVRMNRTPPIEIRRELRSEVGFGCPVPGCGSPYLYWHHFDPPWRERQHHDPAGMIALCGLHHPQADQGAFTKEQLLEMKAEGAFRNQEVYGRLEWMREDLLTVVGGNFYYETPAPVRFRDRNLVGLTRDERGRLLLEANILSTCRAPRMAIEENFWIVRGEPIDVKCPPHGPLVCAEYANGDRLRVEFIPDLDASALAARYPDAGLDRAWGGLPDRIAAVEIQMRVGGTEIEFGPRESRLPGGNVMRNCFASRCGVGLQMG